MSADSDTQQHAAEVLASTRQLSDARRTWPSHLVALIVAGLLVLLALLTYDLIKLVTTGATQTQIRSAQAAQQLALLQGCQRGNIQRAQNNRTYQASWEVFSFVEQRFTIPTKTETPAQKKITQEFADKLKRAVTETSWTPLTNCAKAVNEQGAHYRSPEPVPFSVRMPPASAL